MILQKTYQTLILYLLVMIVVLVYSTTLTAEPLTWNDDSVLSYLDAMQKGNVSVWNNPAVKPIPLEIFSYLYSFGDGRIFLFHLVNILSHVTNMVLLFLLFKQFQRPFSFSIITVAIFGVHTMHAGTIAWISQFPIILSLTILLLSAHAYIKYCRTNNLLYYISVIFFAIIFHLTVNGGLQFLVLLCGIDLLENGNIPKRMMFQKIPFLLFFTISVVVSNLSLPNLYYESVNFIRFGIIEGFFKIVTLVQSSGISPIQDIVDRSIVLGYSVYPILVPFIILFILWFGKNQKVILFSFVGFLLFGIPMLTWSESGEWLLNSEKYYICSLFILFPICFSLYEYGKKLIGTNIVRIAMISFVVSAIGFISFQTSRSTVFRQKNFSFWSHVVSEYPNNAFILNKIGTYHFSRYEIGPAISFFSQSINIHPEHYESYNNRGLAYLSIYQTDSAKVDFLHAIEIYPQYPLAFYNLSTLNSLLSEWKEAITNCTKAIELQPDFVQAYNNRANTYAKQKKYVQAFSDYETAAHIDPKYADIYGNRALIFLETGNVTNAIWDFKRQRDLVPNRFDVLIHLGLSYIMAGDSSLALEAIAQAVHLDSTNAKMYLSAVQSTFLRDSQDLLLLKDVQSKIDQIQK